MYSNWDDYYEESGNWTYWHHTVNMPTAKTPKDCTIWTNGKPCLACERQSKLRDQIEETTKLLDKLLIEEREARSEINRYHDPLHRLPLEITSHIFCFTLPDFTKEYRRHSERGAFTLSAVCQAWRTIAWSTPHLWAKVMLNIKYEPTYDNLALIEQWLERSRQVPLTIRLEFENCDNINKMDTYMVRKFVDLFNKHSPRWETLSIRSPTWLCELFTGNEYGAPLLKTLQVAVRQEIHTKFALKGAMPKPSHVIGDGCRRLSNLDISWDNVTYATVASLSWIECLQLLHLATKLVYLSLPHILLDDRNPPIPYTHIVHRSLQTLNMPSPPTSIFDSVTLPSLQCLDVHGSRQDATFNFKSLKELLNRSSSPLIDLHLDQITSGQQEALDSVSTLPASLKSIKLNIDVLYSNRGEEDYDLDILFDHFSRIPAATTNGTPPQLLPNLETFEYNVNAQIPWGHVLDLICPISGKQRPFKKLTVVQRNWYEKGRRQPPLLYATGKMRDQSIIRDLIKLKKDGVDLFLPRRVSSQDLLKLLQE